MGNVSGLLKLSDTTIHAQTPANGVSCMMSGFQVGLQCIPEMPRDKMHMEHVRTAFVTHQVPMWLYVPLYANCCRFQNDRSQSDVI